MMLDLSEGICALFAADRLTIYTVGEDKASLVSKVKTGMASFRQLRLPISAQSIAGYAALARRLLNLADVYDAAELQRYAADLRFQQGVDRRTGYRTTQMLVVPIMHDDDVIGVFQLINNLRGGPFDSTVVEGARYLCDTLAIAFAQRRQETKRERTGFVGALGSRPLPREQVEQAVEQARTQGRDIEDVLLDDFKLKLPVVGRALGGRFRRPLPRLPSGGACRRQPLPGMDRAGAEVRQWLPVERNEHALYVVCIDPEKVKADNAVTTLFPQSRPVFCVTTRRDFAAMLDQYFGAAAPPRSRSRPRADKLVDTVAAMVAGSHREGLSDLRIEDGARRAAGRDPLHRQRHPAAALENRQRRLPTC
ncbi:GAF domain-containing protein [Massilia phosphatilytica]